MNNLDTKKVFKENVVSFNFAALMKLNGYVTSRMVKNYLIFINEMFVELENDENIAGLFNKLISLCYYTSHLIEEALNSGWTNLEVRKLLPDVYRIFGNSSFGRHIQIWPRGYPGDFQAINMIVDRVELSPENSFEGIFSRYILNSPITEQHRQKLLIQAEEIKEKCFLFKNPNILSIACGSSRDIESVQEYIRRSGANLLLMDFDQAALEHSMARLSQIGDQIETMLINVKDLLRLDNLLRQRQKKYHLIYAGGLFDYLEKNFVKKISKIRLYPSYPLTELTIWRTFRNNIRF